MLNVDTSVGQLDRIRPAGGMRRQNLEAARRRFPRNPINLLIVKEPPSHVASPQPSTSRSSDTTAWHDMTYFLLFSIGRRSPFVASIVSSVYRLRIYSL